MKTRASLLCKAMNEWIEAPAPAKINLNLHVTGQRPDGYHAIESLVVFADCGDHLSARLVPVAGREIRDRLAISGPFGAQLSNGSKNLVMGAVEKFRARWPEALDGEIQIELGKNLPVAAGIGGGSADAAAMLKILNQLSRNMVLPQDLLDLALELGADVPVCLQGQPAIMRGIGQKLDGPIPLPPLFGVLVNPMKAVATSRIFNNLEQRQNGPLPLVPAQFLNIASLIDWLSLTRNDLTSAASELVPEIGEITGWMRRNDQCLLARMSGSGASIFALFETGDQAQSMALACRRKWPGFWVRSWSSRDGAPGQRKAEPAGSEI